MAFILKFHSLFPSLWYVLESKAEMLSLVQPKWLEMQLMPDQIKLSITLKIYGLMTLEYLEEKRCCVQKDLTELVYTNCLKLS